MRKAEQDTLDEAIADSGYWKHEARMAQHDRDSLRTQLDEAVALLRRFRVARSATPDGFDTLYVIDTDTCAFLARLDGGSK